jgi:hypothetical protein
MQELEKQRDSKQRNNIAQKLKNMSWLCAVIAARAWKVRAIKTRKEA